MKIFIETNNIILREMLVSDIDGIFELHSDPEVHKYLGNNIISSTSEALEIINMVRQQYVDNGIGRWTVIDKKNGDFVGWAGLKLVKELTNNHINYYDVGYRLLRKYWGNGIGTECAFESIKYGFNVLNLSEIFAAAHEDNTASNKILIKCGRKLIEVFDVGGVRQNWYRIASQEWQKP